MRGAVRRQVLLGPEFTHLFPGPKDKQTADKWAATTEKQDLAWLQGQGTVNLYSCWTL